MSKSVEETRRELFESLATTKGLNLWYRFKGGDYADEKTASAWWAFNAALDAVENELPSPATAGNDTANMYVNGWNAYHENLINKLKSIGVIK